MIKHGVVTSLSGTAKNFLELEDDSQGKQAFWNRLMGLKWNYFQKVVTVQCMKPALFLSTQEYK